MTTNCSTSLPKGCLKEGYLRFFQAEVLDMGGEGEMPYWIKEQLSIRASRLQPSPSPHQLYA